MSRTECRQRRKNVSSLPCFPLYVNTVMFNIVLFFLTGCRRCRRSVRSDRRAGLFGVDELAQNAAEMGERRVREDGQHLEAGIFVECLLLALDDRLVLHESLDEAGEQ